MHPDKLIINAAITGCVLQKADNPHLPISKDEIVKSVQSVVSAGASIVHLHARLAGGQPSFEPEHYSDIVEGVRATCPEVVVCVSLSGRHVQDIEQRSAPLLSSPDMASLTLGSLNFPTQASINPPDTICELARRIYAANAVPELEIFEPGFVHYSKTLIKREILKPPLFYNLILGSLGSAPVDLLGLGHMVSLLPPDSIWAVGGIGRFQLQANMLAIASGGHVRVGLEDNPYFDKERTTLATNLRLVERLVRIASEMGREPATPGEVRKLLNIKAAQYSASQL